MKISLIKTSKKPNKNSAKVSLERKSASQVKFSESGYEILSIGIGTKKINHRKLILIARKVVSLAKQNLIKSLVVDFSDFLFEEVEFSPEEVAEALAINFELANFEYTAYKTEPEDGWNCVEEIVVSYPALKKSIKDAFQRGQIIGQEMNNCRSLINTPSSDMTPTAVAEKVEKMFKGTDVKVRIFGRKEIEKHKMGAILGVSRGALEEPRFIILEYMNAPKADEKPVILVGKAVTYDTGGLCLKPSGGLTEMHMDMSGGGVVIHALALAEKLKLKQNVVGIIPTVENILSQTSYRPGDILRSMSGKTVEVLNTDAEGRLILADALTYAEKHYKPKVLVDVATLTGASRIALGLRATALFTADQKLETRFRELGEKSGDYVWPLPLWEEFDQEIKGDFGDITNVLYSGSRYGGAIIGATFLHQFVNGSPWVHLDIAPRMTSLPDEYLASGATGEPLRLLAKVMQEF